MECCFLAIICQDQIGNGNVLGFLWVSCYRVCKKRQLVCHTGTLLVELHVEVKYDFSNCSIYLKTGDKFTTNITIKYCLCALEYFQIVVLLAQTHLSEILLSSFGLVPLLKYIQKNSLFSCSVCVEKAISRYIL